QDKSPQLSAVVPTKPRRNGADGREGHQGERSVVIRDDRLETHRVDQQRVAAQGDPYGRQKEVVEIGQRPPPQPSENGPGQRVAEPEDPRCDPRHLLTEETTLSARPRQPPWHEGGLIADAPFDPANVS